MLLGLLPPQNEQHTSKQQSTHNTRRIHTKRRSGAKYFGTDNDGGLEGNCGGIGGCGNKGGEIGGCGNKGGDIGGGLTKYARTVSSSFFNSSSFESTRGSISLNC